MTKPNWVCWIQVVVLGVVAGIAVNRSAAQSLDNGVAVQDCVVRFASEVNVPATQSGRLSEVFVKLNDQVQTQQPIAKLDDRTMFSRRTAIGVKLDAATDAANDDVELRYAETALQEAEEELQRNRKIQSEMVGSVARQRMTQLRLAVERGQLEVARAKKQMERATAEVKIQQAEVAILDHQLRELNTLSPISGVVLDLAKSAGEWVEKGETIATIAKIDKLHIHALVDARKIAPFYCPGSQVTVRWADPSTGKRRLLTGVVLSVDPQRLPDNRFRLHAEVSNRTEPQNSRQWQLNPGTEVQMTVHPRSGRSAAAIGTQPKR